MHIDIEKKGNHWHVETQFIDFKSSAVGDNWQQAMAKALQRVEAEMVMRLYHAGVLHQDVIDLVEKGPEPISTDREECDRWFGLEMANGQVVGKDPPEFKEGQVPCSVCGAPTFGTLCSCCLTFAEADWEKHKIRFRTPKLDKWTTIKILGT